MSQAEGGNCNGGGKNTFAIKFKTMTMAIGGVLIAQ